MKKENIKKFKNFNIGVFISVAVILFLFHSKLIGIHANMSLFINAFLWAGVATVYFSNRFLTSIESSKDGIDVMDFFSPIGRKEIAKYPDRYFSDDNYKIYKINFTLMTVAFIITIVVLSFIAISIMR